MGARHAIKMWVFKTTAPMPRLSSHRQEAAHQPAKEHTGSQQPYTWHVCQARGEARSIDCEAILGVPQHEGTFSTIMSSRVSICLHKDLCGLRRSMARFLSGA